MADLQKAATASKQSLAVGGRQSPVSDRWLATVERFLRRRDPFVEYRRLRSFTGLPHVSRWDASFRQRVRQMQLRILNDRTTVQRLVAALQRAAYVSWSPARLYRVLVSVAGDLALGLTLMGPDLPQFDNHQPTGLGDAQPAGLGGPQPAGEQPSSTQPSSASSDSHPKEPTHARSLQEVRQEGGQQGPQQEVGPRHLHSRKRRQHQGSPKARSGSPQGSP